MGALAGTQVLEPLRLACLLDAPRVVEPALACLHKLVCGPSGISCFKDVRLPMERTGLGCRDRPVLDFQAIEDDSHHFGVICNEATSNHDAVVIGSCVISMRDCLVANWGHMSLAAAFLAGMSMANIASHHCTEMPVSHLHRHVLGRQAKQSVRLAHAQLCRHSDIRQLLCRWHMPI